MEDAYSKIYNMMRSAPGDGRAGAPIHIRLGKVLSASPLKVDVAGTTQEAGRFYIAKRLLDGHTAKVDIRWENMTIDRATVIRAGPGLAAGDLVLLLTEDDQTFYLMDKVVHL